MAPPTVKDVLAFHRIDRAVYERFVAHGAGPGTARNAVALFMWLEQLGLNTIHHITQNITDPITLLRLIAEAEAVLHCLQQDDGLSNYSEIPTNPPLIPTISAMAEHGGLDIRFFDFHRDVIVRGLAGILDTVGRVVFDDYLYDLLCVYEARVGLGVGVAVPPVPPELAARYDPAATAAVSEDARSMFITFSKGFPIRREEILEHFTERWGDCVDRVMMERTPPGGTPMYGRIVFKSDTYISLVLSGEQVVKYNINGRQLWARKYVPRPAID